MGFLSGRYYSIHIRFLKNKVGSLNMQHSPDSSSASSRPGYLAEVTLVMVRIRDTAASGRLSIRNGEQFGIAHLYFKQALLVHVTGDKRDGEIVLQDLLSWSKGNVRFDLASTVEYEDVTWQQAQIFARWLSLATSYQPTRKTAASR